MATEQISGEDVLWWGGGFSPTFDERQGDETSSTSTVTTPEPPNATTTLVAPRNKYYIWCLILSIIFIVSIYIIHVHISITKIDARTFLKI